MRQALTLFVLATLIAGCSLSTPVAENPPPATPTASASPLPAEATPVPQATREASLLPSPALPTATPIGTPVAGPGRYENPDLGVSFDYPPDWEATPGDGQSSLLRLSAPSAALVVVVFSGPLPTDSSPEQAAQKVRTEITASLNNVTEQEIVPLTLDDGRTAWSGKYRGNDGVNPIQALIVSTGRGEVLVTALVYGQPEGFVRESAAIDALVRSIRLTETQIYGLPRDEVLVLSGSESTNPRDYDPAVGRTDRLIYSGLVSFDPQLDVVPDLAESWEVSADGRVYTFTLRADARFHDGRPLTAQDVVYSWERALDPALDSHIALTYLGDIVGAAERRSGAASSISGLRVLDPQRLEATIAGARPYFLMKLTAGPALVVDQANVESGPEWFRTPNGTGPYRLTRWEPFKMKLYERNDAFYLKPPAIRYIVSQLFAGYGVRLYETGQVDMAGIASFDVARLKAPDEPLHTQMIESVDMCTSFVAFDVTQPPFDDARVRQAFALAIDRERFVDVALRGVGIAAEGVYPPGLPGHSLTLEGQRFDPELARRLLAESKYGSAEKLPPIVFTDSGFGSDVDSALGALIAMWQTNLGVTINVENLEPNTASDQIYSGNHGQLFWNGWCADYPDPENFADALFHSKAPQNIGKFSSAALDQLLEQARSEPDVTRRLALYQQAEQLIIEEAGGIFLSHSLSHLLVKPYIKGYTATPISLPIERYMSFDATLRPQ